MKGNFKSGWLAVWEDGALDGEGGGFYWLSFSGFASGQLLGQTALNSEEMQASETLQCYIILLNGDSNSGFAGWKV